MYHIILSGTGPRYVAFIGSMSYLFKKFPDITERKEVVTNAKNIKYYKNIKTISGSSGGSLIAMVLSLGYSISDMKNIAVKIGYNETNDLNITEFLTSFGVDSGRKFENMLKALVKFKYGKNNLTFKQLYDYTGIKLIITATCLSNYKLEYFNYINTPDLELWKAVRMSSCVPYLYAAYEYNQKLYIDGALCDFFPMNVMHDENVKNTFDENDHVIGIKLDDMLKNKDKKEVFKNEINNIVEFSLSFIMTLSTVIYDLREEYIQNNINFKNVDIISYNTAHIGSLSFDISENDRELLFSIGHTRIMEYYEQKEKELYNFCSSFIYNIIDKNINLPNQECNKNQLNQNPSNNDQ